MRGYISGRSLYVILSINFDLVNVEVKLVYSLHFETFHGTIASINLPQFRQCHADTEEEEEKS